ITRRCGRLDRSAMAELVRRQNIRLLVDATHPYAVSARATAQQVAHDAGIPYLSYLRPSACSQSGAMHRDGLLVPTHEQAAQAACAENCPVLLTVGSRNVAVYAREAARRGVNLVVRVLDCQDAVEACRAAGIPEERIVTGRGPFGVEENRALIR